MILICDFNPKIKKIYRVVDFVKNSSNTYTNSRTFPSGYGIDMLVFLKSIGENPKLLTYLGGERGEEIKKSLLEIGADFNFYRIKDESFEQVEIKSRSLKTRINSEYPKLTTEDLENFYLLFTKEALDKKIVCLPKTDHELFSEIYENLISYCYKNDIKIAISIDDIDILKTANPYMLIVDKETLEDYTKLKISTMKEVIGASNLLLNRNIGIVIIVSEKGLLITTKSQNYYVKFEQFRGFNKFNKDLFLSGIAMALDREYDFETSIKLATASGLFENYMKFRQINIAEIKKIMSEVEVEKIGG